MNAVRANVSLGSLLGVGRRPTLAILILAALSMDLGAQRVFSQSPAPPADLPTTTTLADQPTTPALADQPTTPALSDVPTTWSQLVQPGTKTDRYFIPADVPMIETSDWGKLPEQALWNQDNSLMILVPAGEFTMGLDFPDRRGGRVQEGPAHKVYLSTYYIDQYEVTNAQYVEFCKATGHIVPRVARGHDLIDPTKPVVGVTWDDSKAYADWVGKQLPTEAQWEKAARGDKELTYPWGDTWVPDAANTKEAKRKTTAPPGSFPKDISPYKVFDMAGNASEWCSDWYERDYYKSSPKENPTGPAEGNFSRSVRGGDYYYGKDEARLTSRRFRPPNQPREECGFRCVKVVGLEVTPTPKPDLSSYLPPTPTPVMEPFRPIEGELLRYWKAGQPLPASLTPVNAGRQMTVVLVNSLPIDVHFSVVSAEPQIVLYDQKLPALERRDVRLGMDKDLGLFVKMPKVNRIVQASPVFRSNSRPSMIITAGNFLPTIWEVGDSPTKPQEHPELSIYYDALNLPWNEVYFFNDASTTVTLKFPECPLVRRKTDQTRFDSKPYLVSLGPQSVWDADMLPGKHTFETLYLAAFDSGAKPREIDINDNFDRRAVILSENTRTNVRVRVFARMLPPVETTVLETKLGSSGRR